MTRSRRESGGAMFSLPDELLLVTLRAADPPTRVRASHVSHTWRNVALSDCRLWDSFMCLKFRGKLHEDAMFEKLQEMLNRSRSVRFRLGMPRHSSCTDIVWYVVRVCSLVRPHVGRLALYDGPLMIFYQLNKVRAPFPALTSLRIVDTVDLSDKFFSGRLPNLQCLEAHHVSFSTMTDPLVALRDLTCFTLYTNEYPMMFELCPNLVHVVVHGINASDVLPPILMPYSLRTVTLWPQREGLNIARLVEHWAGEHLPLLVLHEARSLHGVLPRFLLLHLHRIELRLNSRAHELELRTLPDDGTAVCTWRITPSPSSKGFLSALETRSCHRLTSISVAMEQLGRLFAAQLETPGLEFLRFRLLGTQESPPLEVDDEHLFIRALRLQRISFDLSGHVAAVREHEDDIRGVLDVLRGSFRALIIYDAELLESITVSIPAKTGMEIDCAAFSHFAKEYTVLETV